MRNVADPLETLKRELRAAREHFDKNPQEGATVALSALLEFVGEAVPDEQSHTPVVALLGAMIDASEGRGNPLLKPAASSPNAPRTFVADDVDIGRAAAVVTLLKDAGETLPDALRKVSRALGGSLDSEQLKDQRKRITRANDKHRANELAVRNYDAVLKTAREAAATGMTKHAVAADALDFLSRTASLVRKVEQPRF